MEQPPVEEGFQLLDAPSSPLLFSNSCFGMSTSRLRAGPDSLPPFTTLPSSISTSTSIHSKAFQDSLYYQQPKVHRHFHTTNEEFRQLPHVSNSET